VFFYDSVAANQHLLGGMLELYIYTWPLTHFKCLLRLWFHCVVATEKHLLL
jgi:hypothetical protein